MNCKSTEVASRAAATISNFQALQARYFNTEELQCLVDIASMIKNTAEQLSQWYEAEQASSSAATDETQKALKDWLESGSCVLTHFESTITEALKPGVNPKAMLQSFVSQNRPLRDRLVSQGDQICKYVGAYLQTVRTTPAKYSSYLLTYIRHPKHINERSAKDQQSPAESILS